MIYKVSVMQARPNKSNDKRENKNSDLAVKKKSEPNYRSRIHGLMNDDVTDHLNDLTADGEVTDRDND